MMLLLLQLIRRWFPIEIDSSRSVANFRSECYYDMF